MEKKLSVSTSVNIASLEKITSENSLVQLLVDEKFEDFQKELNSTKNLDVLDIVHEDLDNCRVLEYVVKNVRGDEYLTALIHAGVNVNQKNEKNGEVALHYAAESAKFTVVKALLESNADPNIQNRQGETPLHKLILKWDSSSPNYVETLKLLLKNPQIAVNVPNSNGITPIHLAALKNENFCVTELLKLKQLLDLDSFKCFENKETAREAITKVVDYDLPEPWKADPTKGIRDYKYRLFYNLRVCKHNTFCRILTEAETVNVNMPLLISSLDGKGCSYLHHAAKRGFIAACQRVIKYGAEVNVATVLAAKEENSLISFLVRQIKDPNVKDINNETMLHKVVKQLQVELNPRYEYILQSLVKHPDININEIDENGRTPLHLAVNVGNEKCIFLLLDNNADLGIGTHSGNAILKQISRSSLEKYFDSKISTNTLATSNDNFRYSFDYTFLNPFEKINTIKKNRSITEKHVTDFLQDIKYSEELYSLLSHPILATLILLKWKRIRKFFYFLLCFYIIFCLCLTISIFISPILRPSLWTIQNTNTSSYHIHFSIVSKYFLVIYAICLAISEMYQLINEPRRYFLRVDNWLQFGVIVSTFTLIGTNCLDSLDQGPICKDVSAFAMFFTWFELFFVIGQHPKTSRFVEMFRRASLFLIKFLMVHTCLILSFAFSFHIVFNDVHGFSTILDSVFKTVAMVTGEYELKDIPLSRKPFTSYILFLLFIFLVAIVLFNLLIGLAVSTTKPIESDTFLYSCLAQVPIISFYEKIFFYDNFFVHLFKKCCLKISKEIDYSILEINLKNKPIESHQVANDGVINKVPLNCYISKTILEKTEKITSKTIRKYDENSTCKTKETRFQSDCTLADLDEKLRVLTNNLTEVFEKLENYKPTAEVDNSFEKPVSKKKLLKRAKLQSVSQFKSYEN